MDDGVSGEGADDGAALENRVSQTVHVPLVCINGAQVVAIAVWWIRVVLDDLYRIVFRTYNLGGAKVGRVGGI